MNPNDIKPIIIPEKSGSIKEKIADWYYQSFLYNAVYFFVRPVKKLIKITKYAIFLWNDFDFDYIYLLKIIDFKIERMRKEIVSSPWKDGSEVVKQMEHVQDLLKHYIEDDFCDQEYEDLSSRYKSIDRFEKCENGNYIWEIDYKEGDVIYKHNSEQAEKIKEKFSELFDLKEKKRQKCKEEIFDCLKQNIEGWWD